MDMKLAFKPLDAKIEKSKEIIFEAEGIYGKGKIGVLWTGDKDSTILLHLIKLIYRDVPFRVITIDTTVISNEVYEFIKRLRGEWGMELITLMSKDAEKIIKSAKDKDECCYLLKTRVLEEGLREHKLKALMTGIRWDADPAYVNEEYFSTGDDYIRVNPILHFLEKDIQEYMARYDIPYCKLYDKGYTKITCMPCMDDTTTSLGENREKVMERLRSLGYF